MVTKWKTVRLTQNEIKKIEQLKLVPTEPKWSVIRRALDELEEKMNKWEG